MRVLRCLDMFMFMEDRVSPEYLWFVVGEMATLHHWKMWQGPLVLLSNGYRNPCKIPSPEFLENSSYIALVEALALHLEV